MRSMEKLLDTLLASKTETEVLEFKQAKNQIDKDDLGKYFSALSNEANLKNVKQAWLILGIKNDRTVAGTTINENQLNEYKAEIVKHTSPRTDFTNVFWVLKNGKNILLFEIPPAPKGMPVSWKGHFYGRDGESLGALTNREYDKIKSQTATDWSAQIIEGATIADLSEEAIAFARDQYTVKHPKQTEEIAGWTDEAFLNKAKVTIKNKITRTAILLLGKPESEHLISPATAKITWILRDRDNVEKDYEHFTCPLMLETDKVRAKIRIIKYRYIKEGTLFPDEVDQFDPYIIREALNNCIAHQDYTLGGKINVVEREDGYLTFVNSGSFIPESVEKVVESDAPETTYRNPFLANAMVNLNMIDTTGSGIKKMFIIQKNKYFPLPDYDFASQKVKVQITGKVVDINYARKLATISNLTLEEIILLDKVSKQKSIQANEINSLRAKSLIEGRKPNFYISSEIAKATGEKAVYIKHRGFKDEHYKKMILEYIQKYGEASKKEIDDLILDILPTILDKKQKENKVRNIVYAMSKKDKAIENKGTTRNPKWILSSSKNAVEKLI